MFNVSDAEYTGIRSSPHNVLIYWMLYFSFYVLLDECAILISQFSQLYTQPIGGYPMPASRDGLWFNNFYLFHDTCSRIPDGQSTVHHLRGRGRSV